MLDVAIVCLFILAGAGIGFNSIAFLPSSWTANADISGVRWVTLGFGFVFGAALGAVVRSAYRRLERNIREMPTDALLTRSVGLVGGLLLANFLLGPIFLFPFPESLAFIKFLASILASLVFAYLGMTLSDVHGRTLLRRFNLNSLNAGSESGQFRGDARPKIVDTSCIIDGRLEELLGTGFLEGYLVVPRFVLDELQLLSDSADADRRSKGRRGLDILSQLQTGFGERLVLHELDYPKLATVDAKLVRLTQDLEGALVTNDFNLNKVANLQGLTVLNVNDLASVLKPRFLPGDLLQVKVLREGKEPHQGIAYLEDGTMVVIEEGSGHIGEQASVSVTSALQTSAGRMIFARLQNRPVPKA
ncbi:PIN/TRAM domain-containing protein [Gloeobacter violaceus]|uniref:Ycf81 protein n=1 Tax=Gloeobacter violaceus (strain ATCC 29082 / PCC 7421) TaxID=251221 RepID=Q7NC93_GLOVI|nr:TRAM domain-containing protein [Gloeobacter violaceus]BAC91027.1 ycf81 [Gloeobacter violaceus PCC 7421]